MFLRDDRVMKRVWYLVSVGLAVLPGFLNPGLADEDTLRLNFDQSSTPRAEGAAVTTLNELLSLSPRSPGVSMSIDPSDEGIDTLPRIGLGFGDRALGLDYELFASVAGVRGERIALSPLQANSINQPLGLSDFISLGDALPEQEHVWLVGGRVGFGGFSVDADFSRQSRLQDQAEYRDYRLGLSYGGSNWRVGMQYMRSLSSAEDALTGVADAVEFGGSWNLNRSVNLIGGIQFSDQADFGSLDNGSARDAMIFFGTRIQF